MATKLCLNHGCGRPERNSRGGQTCHCESPTWRYGIQVIDPRTGKRIRHTYRTRREAEAQEGKLKSMKAEKRDFLEVRPEYTHTFKELAEEYAKHKPQDVKDFDANLKKPLERAREHFGDALLADIGTLQLSEFMAAYRKEFKEEHGRKPSSSAVNKQVNLLSNIFGLAVDWEWIGKTPFEKLRNRRGRKGIREREKNREAFLTEEEANRIIEESPTHLRELIAVALNTGMRKGELLGLRWDRITPEWIYLKQTKSDRDRQVPINSDVRSVLTAIKARQMKDGTFQKDGPVFMWGGRRLKTVKVGWQAACRRAGVQARFHDLRHTFASGYAKKTKNLSTLQEILGHAQITQTRRYAHFAESDKLEEIQMLNGMVNTNLLPNRPQIVTPLTSVEPLVSYSRSGSA